MRFFNVICTALIYSVLSLSLLNFTFANNLDNHANAQALASDIFKGKNPWPIIRKKRLNTLLPQAMKDANVDAWLIICRENSNDPLAKHIACENAGKTAVFVFYFDKTNTNNMTFRSIAFSPIGEATALRDLQVLDTVQNIKRDEHAIGIASAFIKQQDFQVIAINSSANDPQADGLSHSQYLHLYNALGKPLNQRLTSASELVYNYLSVKLPEEVEIMRKAAELTAKWQIEAYQQVVVGKTTDADLALFLKNKMREYGVKDAWTPDQNPNIVSGTDRGHSHATDRVIQAGDVIQTDFGIKVYDMWVTDIQRFAYVLKENETSVPENIAYYWDSAKLGREAAFNAMKPEATGYDVDMAQREIMQQRRSNPVMWSTGHPVGYVAHDSGPALNSKQKTTSNMRKLKPGMTFAFDGFHSWVMSNGKPKTISVEEMVVITSTGADYLIPPQEQLILIKPDSG